MSKKLNSSPLLDSLHSTDEKSTSKLTHWSNLGSSSLKSILTDLQWDVSSFSLSYDSRSIFSFMYLTLSSSKSLFASSIFSLSRSNSYLKASVIHLLSSSQSYWIFFWISINFLIYCSFSSYSLLSQVSNWFSFSIICHNFSFSLSWNSNNFYFSRSLSYSSSCLLIYSFSSIAFCHWSFSFLSLKTF